MVVDEVFELRGKTVLAPGVDGPHPHRLIGAAVGVVRPDGTAFDASIHGMEMPTPNWDRRYPIMLSTKIQENPVSAGCEVGLSDEG
jgi:hypothetical protein